MMELLAEMEETISDLATIANLIEKLAVAADHQVEIYPCELRFIVDQIRDRYNGLETVLNAAIDEQKAQLNIPIMASKLDRCVPRQP